MEEMTSTGCRFVDCDFTGALLNASLHTDGAFTNCKFTGANLFVAKFENCKMVGSDFANAYMDGITLSGGDWAYTNLRHLNLSRQDLRGIRFTEADMQGCDLQRRICAGRI